MTNSPTAIIEVSAVTAGYLPDVPILNDINFVLGDREIVTIIGPNGAGKSTLIKAIFGMLPITSGSVQLRGNDITSLKPHELVAQGVAYVPQRDNVFPSLTVRENLEMGGLNSRRSISKRITQLEDLFPRLRERSRQAAGSLSGGERQMVAFARALMSEPSVLLLDEPSAGLSPAIMNEVFELIERIRDERGVAVALVEQAARRALRLSDRGYVLDQGTNALTGTGAELLDDDRVIRTYLGSSAAK